MLMTPALPIMGPYGCIRARGLYAGRRRFLPWRCTSGAEEFTTYRSRSTMSYLEVTLQVNEADRPAAASVYTKYKQPFIQSIAGATCKELRVGDDDVQALHGFGPVADAQAYLDSELFTRDVLNELSPLLQAEPEI